MFASEFSEKANLLLDNVTVAFVIFPALLLNQCFNIMTEQHPSPVMFVLKEKNRRKDFSGMLSVGQYFKTYFLYF